MSLAICSCQLSNNETLAIQEDYQESYLERLDRINAIINVSVLDESDFEYKWYRDMVTLPGEEITVSLYVLNSKIHAYNLIENKKLTLTGEQIVDLYSVSNDKIQKEFDEFHYWFLNNGSTKYRSYYNGLSKGYGLYEKVNNKKYLDKDFSKFTLQEEIELEQWIKENPDYELASEEPNYYFLLEILGVENLPEVATECERIYTFY